MVIGTIHFFDDKYERAIKFFEKSLTFEDTEEVRNLIQRTKGVMGKTDQIAPQTTVTFIMLSRLQLAL